MHSLTRVAAFVFSPYGRVSRSAYWFGFQAMWLVALVAAARVDEFVQFLAGERTLPGLFTSVFLIVSSWATFAVGAKRFHDIDLSGWWQVFFVATWFVPISGKIIEHSRIAMISSGVILITSIFLGLVQSLKLGTRGENRYGLNPNEVVS